jgi:predicted O-methyltransferase YrrM
MLEIGIGTMLPGAMSSMLNYALPGYKPGGSLRAWRDFFPNGNILGADIQWDTQFSEDRITTIIADSGNREELDRKLGDERTFDIIIDDGWHWDENQVKTMRNLWHRVRPGGYYIIEDILTDARIATDLRGQIAEIIGTEGYFFLTEKKNQLVASKLP